MDNKSLGELIRMKRKEKNMTQEQLAKLLYVSTNAVSKWELGKNSIGVENLERILDVLGISQSILSDCYPEANYPDINSAESDIRETKTGVMHSKSENTECFPTNNDNCILPEKEAAPLALGGKQTMGNRFFLIGGGIALFVAAAFICMVWQSKSPAFTVKEKYMDVYEEQEACYLIVEYKGEFTLDIVSEYSDIIRDEYRNCFNEVTYIVILYYQDSYEDGVWSIDTADAVAVMESDL